MRKFFSLVATPALFATSIVAQSGPAVSIAGSVGVTGGQSARGMTAITMADANYTMIPGEWWVGTIRLTSSVPLTTKRNLVAPANNGQDYCIENATSGVQAVQVIGPSGTGVDIPNSATGMTCVRFDGTNYVPAGSAGGVTSFNTRTGAVSLNSADVSTALGFTPSAPIPVSVAAATPTSNAWLYALANYPNQVNNLFIYADSYARCAQLSCGLGGGPVTATNRWPEQVRVYGQRQYGSNGTGLVPIVVDATGAIDQNAYSVTGTHDTSNQSLGPSQNSSGTLYHFTSGSVTFNDDRAIPYDKLAIYYATATGTGDINLTIDGVTQTAANAGNATQSGVSNAGYTAQRKDYTVTRGTHIVVASCSNCYIFGFQGIDGNAGLNVHNVAVGGATVDMFGTNTTNQLAFFALVPGGHQGTMLSFLTNDSAYNYGTSNFSTKLTNLVTYERALTTAPSVMVGIPPVSVVNGTYPEAPYTAVLVERCTTLSLTCRNIQDRWGTSYVSARFDLTGGTWPGSGNAGVHPSDAGSRDEGSEYAAMLFNPTGAGGTAGCTSNCTFTGITNISGGTNQQPLVVSSSNASGTNMAITNTGGVQNWIFGVGKGGAGSADHQFQIGNTSTGIYAVGMKALADGSGYLMSPSLTVWGFSSTNSVTNQGMDSGISRTGVNALGCGNGTQGNTTCTFSAGRGIFGGTSNQTAGSFSSSNAAGTLISIGGTATSIHNWLLASGVSGTDSQFLIGDGTTGTYGLAMKENTDGTGYLEVPHQNVVGFSSTSSVTTNPVDAGISRWSTNTLSVGNGTLHNNGGGLIASTYAVGVIPTIASGSTVTFTTQQVIVSGTSAIATINVPNPYNAVNVGGCVDAVATGAWSTTTSGNIMNAISAVANVPYRFCYYPVAAKWYVRDTGAPLNSPAFTGTPTAPTAASSTNTTQIATTAFVQSVASSVRFYAGFTTTTSTSETVSMPGVTSDSACTFAPANASAATNSTSSYISAKGTDSITFAHTATSGMIYDFVCQKL